MSKLTKRGFTQKQADAFVDRLSASHSTSFRARAKRWQGGQVNVWTDRGWIPAGNSPSDIIDIAVTDGTFTSDSTDPYRQSLTIETPTEANDQVWAPSGSNRPLAVFGQWIELFVRIDFDDGSWSPWLKLGEFPIIETAVSTPGKSVFVRCGSWASRVDEFLLTKPIGKNYFAKAGGGYLTRADAVKKLVEEALPDQLFTVQTDAEGGKDYGEDFQLQQGTGRWSAVQQLLDRPGLEAFFAADGNLVIRQDRTDDDSDVLVGPDPGTIGSPVATIRDGQGGTLLGATAKTSREGSANGIVVTVTPVGKRPKNPTNPEVWRTRYAEAHVESGSVAWGGTFGKVPIIGRERKVPKATDAAMTDALQSARRILRKRKGVVRQLTLDALPLWHIEADDLIRVEYSGTQGAEIHYVERVSFGLRPDSTMSITTRGVMVTDPDTGGTFYR